MGDYNEKDPKVCIIYTVIQDNISLFSNVAPIGARAEVSTHIPPLLSENKGVKQFPLFNSGEKRVIV